MREGVKKAAAYGVAAFTLCIAIPCTVVGLVARAAVWGYAAADGLVDWVDEQFR